MDKQKKASPKISGTRKAMRDWPRLKTQRLINYESSGFQTVEMFQYGEVGDLQ